MKRAGTVAAVLLPLAVRRTGVAPPRWAVQRSALVSALDNAVFTGGLARTTMGRVLRARRQPGWPLSMCRGSWQI